MPTTKIHQNYDDLVSKMVLAPPDSPTVEDTTCRFGKKVLHLR